MNQNQQSISKKNFVEAESIPKARYIIWFKEASEYYKNFIVFLKDIKIRKVNKE